MYDVSTCCQHEGQGYTASYLFARFNVGNGHDVHVLAAVGEHDDGIGRAAVVEERADGRRRDADRGQVGCR